MPAPVKLEKLSEIKEVLSTYDSFLVTTYSGLSVEQFSALRTQVREKSGKLKVLKNTLFKRALADSEKFSGEAEKFKKDLKGPVAIAFHNDGLPALSKVFVDFGKTEPKVAIKAAFFEGKYLAKAEANGIANLPTREELLTIIGRGLNTPATKIAIGMREIITKLARAVQAVGEKNG